MDQLVCRCHGAAVLALVSTAHERSVLAVRNQVSGHPRLANTSSDRGRACRGQLLDGRSGRDLFEVKADAEPIELQAGNHGRG